MINVDPSQSLILDLFNPALPINVVISGMFKKGDELTYMSRTIIVPTYTIAPTQIIIPLYYDSIISLTCWKPVSPAGNFSCFCHSYVIQGPFANNVRVINLFSGWISDSNSISYPLVDRVDDTDVLANFIQQNATILPTPICQYIPTLGIPIKVIGFSGTFVTSIAVANRIIGLVVDDGGGLNLQANYNPTVFPALTTVTVYGSNIYAQPFTSDNIITIPLPDMIISNPRRFRAHVLNINANDQWTAAVLVVRPFVDF